MTNEGILEPVQDFLRGFVVPRDGPPLTLDAVLGLSRWGMIALVAGGAAVWLIRVRNAPSPRARPGDWPWWVTGIAIGLIAVVAWPLSAATGRYYGLSMTEPAYAFARLGVRGQPDRVNWAFFMWLAVPLGAYLAARAHARFRWRVPDGSRLLRNICGGLLMGIGAAIAGGCNIGHGLTGVSLLALSSWAATGATILGVWVGAAVFERRTFTAEYAESAGKSVPGSD